MKVKTLASFVAGTTIAFTELFAFLPSAHADTARNSPCIVSGKSIFCSIEQPEVKQGETVYFLGQPQQGITISPGDVVTITAGGCVQTGGRGKTWKRYVNPGGANADRLYHGLFFIPGVRVPNGQTSTVVPDTRLVRFSSINGAGSFAVTESPSGLNYIILGYEDDDYADNGYDAHDDGTNDQCKNTGAAFVTLSILKN